MKKLINDASLNDTIEGMRLQIKDSLPFARKWVKGYRSPKEIFYLLKSSTTYKHDPPGVELLQSMQTLFLDNYWKIPGAGDCDCFTIAYSACMIAVNIPVQIVLAGRKPDEFTHVYNYVRLYGDVMPADLTNGEFGSERDYPYIKIIKI